MFKIQFTDQVQISIVKHSGKDQEGIIFTTDLRSGISAVEKQLLNNKDISISSALKKINEVTAAAMLLDKVDTLWQAKLQGKDVVIIAWKIIKVVGDEYRLKSKDNKYCRISESRLNTASYNMAWSTDLNQVMELLYNYCQQKSVKGRSTIYSRDDFKMALTVLDNILSRRYDWKLQYPVML